MIVSERGGKARGGGLALLLVWSISAWAQTDASPRANVEVTPADVAASGPAVPVPASAASAPANAGFSQPTDDTDDASAGARARGVAAKWRVEVEAPDDLQKLLLKYLEVSRFRDEGKAKRKGLVEDLASSVTALKEAATKNKDTDEQGGDKDGGESAGVIDRTITMGELRRLVAATPVQARQLLQTEGYFAATVQVSLIPAAKPEDEAVVRVKVEPGAQVEVGAAVLRFQGDLDRRASQQDATAVALVKKLQNDWSLEKGDAFNQSKWASAKSAVLAAMRAQGYLSTSWSGTSASIDQQANQANLFLIADSGPLYHFGPLTIDGLMRIPPTAVENLRSFREGDPYTDKQLFDFQERLQKLGLFSSVSVTVEPDPDHADAAPVAVRLKEQSMEQSTFGIGYSANTGARISLEQLSRQVFDWDWQAKTVIELGTNQSTFKTDFTSYPLPGMRHNLFSAAIDQLTASGSTTHSESLKAGRSRDEERIERTYYVEWQRARVVGSSSNSTEASAVTANVQWVRRVLDNVMAPTDGFATSVEVALGQSYATDQASGPFARVLWRTLAYQPLPGSWFASGRLDLGRVQAKPDIGIPDTLLFRAGGDDSIRGYDYRSIGPTRDGVAVGGRTMATGSVELAHPIWADRPAWLWAVFVDAGDAEDDVSDMRFNVGYGAGVRWRSPVGALRIDLAYGQQAGQVRLHLSLGMAF